MRPASRLLLLVALLATVTACRGTTERSDRLEPPSAGPTATVTPTAQQPLPVDEELVRYTWTLSMSAVDDEGGPPVRVDDVLQVRVDRQGQIAILDYDHQAVPAEHRADLGAATIVYVDDRTIVRTSNDWLLDWKTADDPNPETWYAVDHLGTAGLPDILPVDASRASLFEQLGRSGDVTGRQSFSAEEIDALGLEGDHLFAGLARAGVEGPGPLWIEVDDEGDRISEIRFGIEGDASFTIDLEYDSSRFDVPTLTDVQPVPTRPPDPTPAPADFLDGPTGLPRWNEVALRLNLYLGNDDLDVVLTHDYRLVRVDRTDIFAGPADFVQWQLTRAGAERLLAAALANPAVASGEYNVAYRQGAGLDIGAPPSELNGHPSNPQGDIDYSEDIDDLVALLRDPEWLGDDVLGGPEPWVPDTLTVIARPTSTHSTPQPWPLSESITDLGQPDETGDTNGVVLCLVGDQVGPVWALLGGGVNHAHLGLDDGELWDARVLMNWPGYRLLSDPCGPDYDLLQQRLQDGLDDRSEGGEGAEGD